MANAFRGGQRHREQPGQHLASTNWREICKAERLPESIELLIPGLDPGGIRGEGFRISAKLTRPSATRNWSRTPRRCFRPATDTAAHLDRHRRPVTPAEHTTMRERWKALQQENAPFRITTGTDLVSAPEDHFDTVLITEATAEPQKAARIVGNALSHYHTFAQVGDLMLLARLVALIEAGKLIADGDPWDMRGCLVRLPG